MSRNPPSPEWPRKVKAAKGWKLLGYDIPIEGIARARIQKGKMILDVLLVEKDGKLIAGPDEITRQSQPWELEEGMEWTPQTTGNYSIPSCPNPPPAPPPISKAPKKGAVIVGDGSGSLRRLSPPLPRMIDNPPHEKGGFLVHPEFIEVMENHYRAKTSRRKQPPRPLSDRIKASGTRPAVPPKRVPSIVWKALVWAATIAASAVVAWAIKVTGEG